MSNTNCRDEFLEHIDGKIVLCVVIERGDIRWVDNAVRFTLNVGYTQENFNNFLDQLNFTYDSGYGGQELFGTIWYKNGSWSERGEYDGSEWWSYKECPAIPEYLGEHSE